jgi:ABC-type sugar transport system ATPase subunit
MASAPLLDVRNLSKAFPGIQALSSVDFDVYLGEVHCLIGENGAGKSTLVKILAGAQPSDSGTVHLNGESVTFGSPLDAQNAGIACIYQELNVVGGLSIAENIVLGSEPSSMGFFDQSAAQKIARGLLDEIGFPELDETRLCRSLSTAEKQAVMIAKTLRSNAKIIIMDEPTSPLEKTEVRKLFDVIQKLKAAGKGVVYVSHKMHEIDELGDRITVFKDGVKVATLERGAASTKEFVRLMVGRRIEDMFPKRDCVLEDVVLQASNLSGPTIKDISFDVRRGEILGIGGLVGSGRTELLRSLFGAELLTGGTLTINGSQIALNSTRKSIQAGLAFVPEERRTQGIFPMLTVFDNASLVWDEFPDGRASSDPKSKAIANAIERLSVKTPSLAQRIDKLSGGNQQKVVLSKWLLAKTSVMLLDEPTRGVDVGAKREIYQIMSDLAQKGMSIILVSSELPELLGLADRIIVMNSGAIVGELSGDATEEDVVALSMMHVISDDLAAAIG